MPDSDAVPLDQRLSIAEIIDGSFQRFRASKKAVAAVVVAAVVPVVVTSGALNPQGIGSRPSLMSIIVVSRPQVDDAQALIVALLYNGVTLPLATAGLLALGIASRAGRTTSMALALQGVRRHGLRMIAIWWLHFAVYAVLLVPLLLIAEFGYGGLTALGVIGAVATPILVPFMSLSMPLAVIEDLRPVPAIRRSFALTSRRFFGVSLVVFASTLMLLALSAPLLAVAGGLAGSDASFRWFWAGLADIAIALLQVPITVFVALLLTIDTRSRVEAADLIVRAEAKAASKRVAAR